MQNVVMLRECFATYGLNKYRNFLAKDYVELYDTEELASWMAEQIELHECPESAIFGIGLDLTMYVAITELNEDDELVIVVMSSPWNMDLFSEIDSEYRLCCYSLIEEISPGIWKVLED